MAHLLILIMMQEHTQAITVQAQATLRMVLMLECSAAQSAETVVAIAVRKIASGMWRQDRQAQGQPWPLKRDDIVRQRIGSALAWQQGWAEMQRAAPAP